MTTIMLTRLALGALVVVAFAQAPAAQSNAVTIRAGTVLDGRGGTLQNVTLRIDGSRIAAIDQGRTGGTYDLRGLTVMPGWIDTHVHIGAHFGANGRASNEGETPAQEALAGAENAPQPARSTQRWCACRRYLSASGRSKPGSASPPSPFPRHSFR